MKKLLPIVIALLLVGAACSKNTTFNQQTTDTSSISWSFNGADWQANGAPPACPTPLLPQSPVDTSLVTSILYPGQTRGGQYKPHGGFRFYSSTNTVTVVAPMDASVVNGSRYIEQGETQYLLEFVNPCGMMYRFDHLLTLSPAMQVIVNQFPAAKVDDSRTTPVNPPVGVKVGDVIATAIGFEATKNVSVDFGLYDLRQKNTASASDSYAASHEAQQAQHAVCWLTLLPAADATRVQSLAGGDDMAAKTSDYCGS